MVSKKCQNYDAHQLDCQSCESRVIPAINLGGMIPEGEFIPDLQESIKIVQDKFNKPLADPDRQGERLRDSVSMIDASKRFEKATNTLQEHLGKSRNDFEAIRE